ALSLVYPVLLYSCGFRGLKGGIAESAGLKAQFQFVCPAMNANRTASRAKLYSTSYSTFAPRMVTTPKQFRSCCPLTKSPKKPEPHDRRDYRRIRHSAQDGDGKTGGFPESIEETTLP